MDNGLNVIPDVKVVDDTRSPEYRRELEKASREFEGILLAQMFRAMRSTVPESDFMGKSSERKIYEDLLFSEAGGLSARSGSLGIADMLYRSFVGQAAADEPPAPDTESTSKS